MLKAKIKCIKNHETFLALLALLPEADFPLGTCGQLPRAANFIFLFLTLFCY